MSVGQKCSFYHEGGHGERRWVVGWRCGVIRSIPSKGSKKNWVQIELSVHRYAWDAVNERWTLKPLERVWVHSSVVNAPGDFRFHGQSAVEVFKERQAEKAQQQARADKAKVPKASKAKPKAEPPGPARGRKPSRAASGRRRG